jgi:uncharacterized Zn-binding protein involved in type VI secretion
MQPIDHDLLPEHQRQVDEYNAKLAARAIKASYRVATLGARTARGGEVVTASTDFVTHGSPVACVGDLVRYPDGNTSAIASGSGTRQWCGAPFALIGSAIANGDTIVDSPKSGMELRVYEDGQDTIPGLLEVGFGTPVVPVAPRGLLD